MSSSTLGALSARHSQPPGRIQDGPLVSFITPCFNSARYIQRCIESVLAQDYPNVEHIIQDGGSTDGTVEILRRYGDRVDWRSEPDNGQSDGLNRALQRCHGDLIFVLNADDEAVPWSASWAVEHMRRYPDVAVVYGDQAEIDADGRLLGIFRPGSYDFERMFCLEMVVPAQAACIRRSMLEDVGFHVDLTRFTCPDFEMFVRIGLRHPMRYAPGIVACYRLHPGSEGCRSDVITGMVRSKREIIDRVLADPSCEAKLATLRKRAYAGLFVWAATMQLRTEEPLRCFSYLARALRERTGPATLWCALLVALRLGRVWIRRVTRFRPRMGFRGGE